MNHILRIRNIVNLLCFTTLFLVFSCTDKLQEEIDQLKAANTELQLQIDVNTSTIEDLELQRIALEAQKEEWQADTALINKLIKKVDRILISKHVERYLNFLIGQEDFSRQSWQHFYDEDLLLMQSDYQVTNSSTFSWFYITGGETSMPVKSQYIHKYNDGLLVSSESEEMLITWTITNGKITEIILIKKDVPTEYTWYLTSKTNGNIVESTYFKDDNWTNKSIYHYNDQNLLVEIDVTHYIEGNSKRLFDYDDTFNLIHYQYYNDGILHTNVTWDYNSAGELTQYLSESPWEIDSIGISYLIDNEWEVFFKRINKDSNSKNINIRRFDVEGHIIYYFSQIDDDYPSIFEYEYINNFLKKYISYYQKRSSSTNEWFVYQKNSIISIRDENGVITDREVEDINYSEDGAIISGTLTAQKDIIWSFNGSNMLEYTEEKYDLFPMTLFEKTDFVKVEHTGLDLIYDEKIFEYLIENGEDLYVDYSFEITDFYDESPFAPRVKEEKWFDANGVTNSLVLYNDNNSTYNWNWIIQN